MHAAIRYFIAFLLPALLQGRAIAQIRVELLNQTISAGYLGTGTDNYVRIHNLPAGAVVSISPGEALQVKGNEYVLCRLGVCVEEGKTATLSVTLKGKIIFSKEYKLLSTRHRELFIIRCCI